MSKLLIDRISGAINPIFAKYDFSEEIEEVNNIYSVLRYSHENLLFIFHVEEMESYYYYEFCKDVKGDAMVFSSPNRIVEHTVMELLTDEQRQNYDEKKLDPKKIGSQIANDKMILEMLLLKLMG